MKPGRSLTRAACSAVPRHSLEKVARLALSVTEARDASGETKCHDRVEHTEVDF